MEKDEWGEGAPKHRGHEEFVTHQAPQLSAGPAPSFHNNIFIKYKENIRRQRLLRYEVNSLHGERVTETGHQSSVSNRRDILSCPKGTNPIYMIAVLAS